ncbi:11804_t:CDS:2 [Rhizophagus irregularis]|nr:11804_t:CDS:2 [Rhizophagus irregularis]
MKVKDDINYIFDLQKIEMNLAKKLVFNKVYFEMEDNQFYIKDFLFKYELFHNFPRILSDIKKILPQEPIPADKMLMTLAMFQPSNSLLILNNSLNSIDLFELIFHFEIILCFIKELSIKNNNILILNFINQWLKLESYNITFIEGFSLKHIIVFYELIEEQIANSIIHNIDEKFKIPLTQQMKDSINNIMNYYDTENQNQQLISAKAFAFALKRFIYRKIN